MKYVLTHYSPDGSQDCLWAKEHTDDIVVYDRTGNSGIENAIPRANLGDADFDKLTYLIDNYYDLPDVFLWSKSNLFKFITKEEFEKVKDNTDFTPLLTQHHKVYEPICRYENGVYLEKNNSWYLGGVPAVHFQSYTDFAAAYSLPNPEYLAFAPGGSYILTKERVHRYGKEFYEELAAMLPYCATPGEAHFLERTYYTLWN